MEHTPTSTLREELEAGTPRWRPHAYSKAMYPILGINFFVSHPSLWWAVIGPLVCLICVSIVTVAVLFAATLYPQYLLIEKYVSQEWLCWIIAVLMVLTECLIAVLIIAQFTFDRVRIRIYNKVFELCEVPLRLRQFDNPLKLSSNKLASWISGRFFLLGFGVSMLLTMPINLIPVVGTGAWACINGMILGWGYHNVYFESKEMGPREQFDFVWSHKLNYVSFGAVAMALDLVPILNVMFFYTSIVGAALWAVEYEYDHTLDVTEGESEAIGQFMNDSDNYVLQQSPGGHRMRAGGAPASASTLPSNTNSGIPEKTAAPVDATAVAAPVYWGNRGYAPQSTVPPRPPTGIDVEGHEVYNITSSN